MTTDAIHEIELSITQAQEFIRRAEALERLYKNPDFQEIVVKGYFEREPIRLVHLKSDPNMQAPDRQAGIIKEMDGIGSLRGYFQVIFMQGNQAQEAISESEEALEEIRKGGEDE